MKQLQTKGIILSRTDYGEADRIITVLTPEHGKLRLMARGVRKVKSKLAGGIELFSVSDLTYIEGKGDLGTLISSRLDKHYGDIVKDIARVQLGYELIKQLNRATEDHPGPEYFTLLQETFEALNDASVNTDLISIWFKARLLKEAGHSPNLRTDTDGQNLEAGAKYGFDYEAMAFVPQSTGRYDENSIKALRLLFSHHSLEQISKVEGLSVVQKQLNNLVQPMLTTFIRS